MTENYDKINKLHCNYEVKKKKAWNTNISMKTGIINVTCLSLAWKLIVKILDIAEKNERGNFNKKATFFSHLIFCSVETY